MKMKQSIRGRCLLTVIFIFLHDVVLQDFDNYLQTKESRIGIFDAQESLRTTDMDRRSDCPAEVQWWTPKSPTTGTES